jgi:hypothetical protein
LLDIHDLSVSTAGEDAADVGDDVDACPIDLPTSCGACGHDCLGGACEGGACQPFAITTQFADPRSIAVDARTDGGIYVADHHAGTVWRKDKLGGDFTQLRWAAPGFAPIALTVDTTHLFWIETQDDASATGDIVLQANKIDGAHRMTLGPWSWSHDLGVDSTDVFFVNRRGVDSIVRAPIDLASSTTIVAGPVTAQRNSIVVAPGAGRIFVSGTDGLLSMNKNGTDPKVLLPAPEVTKIALDDVRIWFAAQNFIGWIGIDGSCAPPADLCPQRYVAYHSDASNVQLAIDAEHIYWTHPVDGLQRARKDETGIPKVEVVAATRDIAGIALDDRAVYFTTSNTVWVVAK